MSTRKMKRFATIAAIAMIASCVAMPMTAAMTASAVDITMNETASTYVAYKLLDLTTSGSGEDVNYAYTLNSKYEAALKSVTGKTTQEEILAYLEGIKDDADAVRTFANKIYGEIKDLDVDATSAEGKFTDVGQGYYLIAETVLGSTADTYSLVMLDTYGLSDVTVTAKENEPSLEKKVKDINDSTETAKSDWQDSADHDITDVVDFQLTGTVSNKLDDYAEYYYAFHDVCCDGLTINYDSFAVYVDGAKITAGYEVVSTGLTDGCTFEVRFKDLKKVSAVEAGSTITVEYTATLNENAEIGSTGNPNEAFLEYSNNPYFVGNGVDADNDGKDDGGGNDFDGDGEVDEGEETTDEETTSNTPEDKVIVFTYKTVINKTDENGDPLTGATFTLEKKIKGVDGAADTWKPLTQVEVGETSTFTFEGLDDGDYRLTEEASPDGYTKLSAPILFTVSATHGQDTDEKPLELTALTGTPTSGELALNANLTEGSLTGSVKNVPGSLLPSTGGIGTTIFYVVGGTMAAGAGVYLISKKRMKKDEE